MFGFSNPTPFDLEFIVGRIPVRVHIFFWVLAAAICWNQDQVNLVPLKVMCIFISILVHELGHAIVIRNYGYYQTQIVLYMGGGYATSMDFGPMKNILVSLAGPFAGYLLFLLTWGITFAIPLNQVDNEAYRECMWFMLYINLVWSTFNLLPIWPLDGGQVLRNWFRYLMPRSGEKRALLVSMGTVILLIVLLSSLRIRMGQIFLAILGFMCYQEYQRISAPGRWYRQ